MSDSACGGAVGGSPAEPLCGSPDCPWPGSDEGSLAGSFQVELGGSEKPGGAGLECEGGSPTVVTAPPPSGYGSSGVDVTDALPDAAIAEDSAVVTGSANGTVGTTASTGPVGTGVAIV